MASDHGACDLDDSVADYDDNDDADDEEDDDDEDDDDGMLAIVRPAMSVPVVSTTP